MKRAKHIKVHSREKKKAKHGRDLEKEREKLIQYNQ